MDLTEKLHFEKEFKVASYNSDFQSKATIQSLLQYFQEVAWEHAEILGVGYTYLIRKKLIWVLVRQKIEIYSYPAWQQTIKVITYAKGKERLFWYRDFKITDENEIEMARATSSWLIIDSESKRPYKGDDLLSIKLGNGKGIWEGSLSKLPKPIETKLFFEKKVYYSDLDINKHVNNVKYLEWILDGYNLDFIENNIIKSFEINYLSETTIGDSIQIYSDLDEKTHLHLIKSSKTNKELINTRISWH